MHFSTFLYGNLPLFKTVWWIVIDHAFVFEQSQLQREKDRQQLEQRQIEISREQKKYLSKELREKIDANQKREVEREEIRIKAMQRRREHREEVQRQREKQIEDTVKRREVHFPLLFQVF